jgi:hypothetical protein
VDNAPADVVGKERERAGSLSASIERLETQMDRIRALV